MRLTEVLLMKELGLSKTEIDNMSTSLIFDYVIILSELKKQEKEKMEAKY